MMDRDALYKGVSRAAWGCFFRYIDFKLGTVSILPAFVGYLLFLSSIRLLEGERRDLALLRPLAVLLALWTGGKWVLSWLGTAPDIYLLDVAALLVSLASLYFTFQLFTDLAALAAAYQGPEDRLDARLLFWRKWQTIFATVVALMTYLPAEGAAWWSAAVSFTAFAGTICGLGGMLALFALRKLFLSAAPEEAA